MKEPPDWFYNAIASGHSMLDVLRLQDRPFTDEEGVAATETWARVLWNRPVQWDEERDAPRLQAGFRALCETVTRWPAPQQLMAALPARPRQEALPAPQPTDEQLQRMREGVRTLRQALGMREPRPPNDADENAMKQQARSLGGKR